MQDARASRSLSWHRRNSFAFRCRRSFSLAISLRCSRCAFASARWASSLISSSLVSCSWTSDSRAPAGRDVAGTGDACRWIAPGDDWATVRDEYFRISSSMLSMSPSDVSGRVALVAFVPLLLFASIVAFTRRNAVAIGQGPSFQRRSSGIGDPSTPDVHRGPDHVGSFRCTSMMYVGGVQDPTDAKPRREYRVLRWCQTLSETGSC